MRCCPECDSPMGADQLYCDDCLEAEFYQEFDYDDDDPHWYDAYPSYDDFDDYADYDEWDDE